MQVETAGVDARGPGPRAFRPPPDPVGPKGWHARGYLPHFDSPTVVQTLTFRLADSLPGALYEAIARTPESRRRFDESLDMGRGGCLLREPEIAAVVARALLNFDGEKYRLLAWVVMPNHVHAMIEPRAGHQLGAIVGSWKTFTAKAINQRTNASGRVWARDYYDRYVRDGAHFARALHYIEQNPVTAGLTMHASEWPYSSAWLG